MKVSSSSKGLLRMTYPGYRIRLRMNVLRGSKRLRLLVRKLTRRRCNGKM